jgi:hypothetical protein
VFDKLTQVPHTEHACPDGFCEVWVGTFDSERRVENTGELYKAIIPGMRHVTALQKGTREVLGYFYVPVGQSIVGHIVQHP